MTINATQAVREMLQLFDYNYELVRQMCSLASDDTIIAAENNEDLISEASRLKILAAYTEYIESCPATPEALYEVECLVRFRELNRQLDRISQKLARARRNLDDAAIANLNLLWD